MSERLRKQRPPRYVNDARTHVLAEECHPPSRDSGFLDRLPSTPRRCVLGYPLPSRFAGLVSDNAGTHIHARVFFPWASMRSLGM